MRRGAAVLCGGQSRRMGRDKASLPFGRETLLGRTVRIISGVVPPQQVVCVAAADQALPPLPEAVRVVRDQKPDQGPLAALALGLRCLEAECDTVLVVGCDSPLLSTGLLEFLFEQAATAEVTIAELDGRPQPFPGVYCPGVAASIEALIASGERSMKALVGTYDCRLLSAGELRAVDPELGSYLNCNNQEDLKRALRRAENESVED